MEALYAHYPGLVVMTPATVEDAYSMLLEAVALDDPVIFCEHKFLYYHLKAEHLPDQALPFGKARITRPGRDATVVTHGAMLHELLAAAEQLSSDGYDIEVVDLRTVRPLDTDTVLASVARTGSMLAVGEAWPWGGVTAEVVARVAAEGFGLLDAPPQRLNAKETPVPYHPGPLGNPSSHRRHHRLLPSSSPRTLDQPRHRHVPVTRNRPTYFPSSCRSSASRSPRPPSSGPPSRSATGSRPTPTCSRSRRTRRSWGHRPCGGILREITAVVGESYAVGRLSDTSRSATRMLNGSA